MPKRRFVEYIAYTILISFFVLSILKIFGVIDLSWWWITSPLWIALLINIFSVIMIYVLLYLIRFLVVRQQKKLEKEFES